MIFVFQLRSLYPDKETEEKYTELVRGFLDFDVEMENIKSFWLNSEALLKEYNQQQDQLRAKQRMLKDDWEKFKAQQAKQFKIDEHNYARAGATGSSAADKVIKFPDHLGG